MFGAAQAPKSRADRSISSCSFIELMCVDAFGDDVACAFLRTQNLSTQYDAWIVGMSPRCLERLAVLLSDELS
jgi:hypothetical protein